MNYNVVNSDEVIENIKKTSKTGIIVLVFGIIFIVLALVGVVMTLVEETMGPVLIILGVPFALMFFIIYFAKMIKSKNKLKNIDFSLIRNELLSNVVSYEKSKTYFTMNYFISNHYYSFVVKYTDIAWIYKVIKQTQYGPIGADLMVRLKNGGKEYTIYSDEFVNELLKHNPSILVGMSSENKKKYKEIVNYNKSVKPNDMIMGGPQYNNTPNQIDNSMMQSQFNNVSNQNMNQMYNNGQPMNNYPNNQMNNGYNPGQNNNNFYN